MQILYYLNGEPVIVALAAPVQQYNPQTGAPLPLPTLQQQVAAVVPAGVEWTQITPQQASDIIAAPTPRMVDTERDRRIALGVSFLGNSFTARTDDLNNIAGAVDMAMLAVMGGVQPGDLHWHGGTTNFGWISQANVLVPMDAFTVIALGRLIARWKTEHIFASGRIKGLLPIPSDYTDDRHWPATTVGTLPVGSAIDLAPFASGREPVKIIPPSLSGAPQVGARMTAIAGAWQGAQPLTFTYQWLRNGVPISGAAGAYYDLAVADGGKTLSCTVTAINAIGVVNATTDAVSIAVYNPVTPNLSQAVAAGTGQTTASASVRTDNATGTLYWVVTTTATAPTAEQVKAGQTAASAPGLLSGSIIATGGGVKSVAGGLVSLPIGASLYIYWMQEAAGQVQSTVISASFTTMNLGAAGSLDWVSMTDQPIPEFELTYENPVIGDAIELVRASNTGFTADVSSFNAIVTSLAPLTVSDFATGAWAARSAAAPWYVRWRWNRAGFISAWSNTVTVEIEGGTDTVPPIISAMSATGLSDTKAQVSVRTDEMNGTIYAVATISATPPSAAQIIAGQNNAGQAAVSAVTQAVNGVGVWTFPMAGLSPSTTYNIYLLHRDAAGNNSEILSATASTIEAFSVSFLGAQEQTADASAYSYNIASYGVLKPNEKLVVFMPAQRATTGAPSPSVSVLLNGTIAGVQRSSNAMNSSNRYATTVAIEFTTATQINLATLDVTLGAACLFSGIAVFKVVSGAFVAEANSTVAMQTSISQAVTIPSGARALGYVWGGWLADFTSWSANAVETFDRTLEGSGSSQNRHTAAISAAGVSGAQTLTVNASAATVIIALATIYGPY